MAEAQVQFLHRTFSLVPLCTLGGAIETQQRDYNLTNPALWKTNNTMTGKEKTNCFSAVYTLEERWSDD